MKPLYVVLFLFFSFSFAKAQNAYLDALQLLEINRDDLDVIIANNAADTPTGQQMRNLKSFLGNPFDPNVTPFEADVFVVYNREVEKINEREDDGAHAGAETVLEKIGSTAGAPMSGSSEFATQAFSALANIIIDRAKAEFTIAYFDKLKTVLDQSQITFQGKTAKLKTIFPKSFQQLSTINLLDHHSASQLLQNAFREDLMKLPDNLHNNLIPDNIKSDLKYRLFRIGSRFVIRVQEGSSIPDVFTEIKTDFADDAAYTDIAPVIKLVNVLSDNLRLAEQIDRRYWIGRAEFFNLGPDGQKYLIGLIYSRNRALFDSFLGQANATRLYEHKAKIMEFISLLEGLDQELRNMRNDGNIAAIANNYSRVLKKAFLAYTNASVVFDIGGTTMAPKIRNAQEWIQLGFDAAQAVKDEDYGALVFTSINILEKAGFTDTQSEAFTKAIRFASFSADMLNAKTAAEKQKVLEDVISPPTTYRTKRSYAKTAYINSYLGLSGGAEWLSKDNSQAGHAGLFAPIGIEVAGATKTEHSNSLFFSVVDLGTIVSYRISDNSDSEGVPEDFKWNSLVTPGLFWVHGFAKSPISLGVGGQFVGDLRKVDGERNSAFRLTAFLSVDIPLFQISAKQN